jgi:hypothetical protein
MNKHADVIKQYAEDWLVSKTPWMNYEFSVDGNSWMGISSHPGWFEDYHYRRKVDQNEIDKKEFNRWFSEQKMFKQNIDNYVFPSDAWFAALAWERSRK